MLNEFADLPTPIDGQSDGAAFWYMLPNSPGADPEYIKKHQLKVLPTLMPFEANAEMQDIEGTEDEIVERMHNEAEGLAYLSSNVWGTYSAKAEDILYMILSFGVLRWVKSLTNNQSEPTKKLFNSLIPKIKKRAREDAEKFQRYYDKYNVMPFYAIHENRLYAYDIACRSFPREMIMGSFTKP